MTYSERILEYCNSVIADNLPNRKCCLYEKQAALRHINDLKRQEEDSFPYYFNDASANRRCSFTEKLQHTKGKWRGQYIRLEPHQIFMDGVMFGWLKKSDSKRRFTKAYVEIPRKNGKSVMSATTGLYMAFADGEKTAEVFAGATTEKQAMMVFEPAFQIVKMNKDFAEYYGLTLAGTPKNPTSIYNIEDMSRFEPIVGKPGDGASPHCSIVDEYHEHPTSVLYDAMDTGMGARDQPLLLVITTAGTSTASPCYELHIEAVKVLEGSLEKDNLFVMLYGLDKDDDYQDFEVWKKVNPNFGISINEDYLRGKFEDALTNLPQRNILLTKHCNLWQNSGTVWMDLLRWKQCEDTTLKLEDFKGCDCWIGLDLASKIDLCALQILFRYKNGIACFGKYYLPSDTVERKENQHYQLWRDEGFLTVTEGAITDFQYIERDLKQLSEQFVIRELAFDQRESAYFIQNISLWASFECVEIVQSAVHISEPMKEMESLVYSGEFHHDGNKMMNWMIGNVIRKQARLGGEIKAYYPTKMNNQSKIDGPMAAIMALARLKTYEDNSDSYNARAKAGEENLLRVI